MEQALLKKIFSLCFFLFFLISSQCGKSKTQPLPVPVPNLQTSPSFVTKCQFYKIQSSIMSCHKDKGFFTESIEQRKNIIASLCAKQAFLEVQGVSINPSLPQSRENDSFQWWFVLGNKQWGNLPSYHLPHPLELEYQKQLAVFKNSLSLGQFNACLGGNYPFDGPTIISTGINMVKLGLLETETFLRCYREQLDLYKTKNACT